MKYTIPFILIFLLIVFANCQQKDTSFKPIPRSTEEIIPEKLNRMFTWHQDIDTIILGDMNKNGINDTVVIYSPVHAYPHPKDFSGGGCEDDTCLTVVEFSFTNEKLYHSRALGFLTFFPLDDLNGDGIREVGFVPNWFQSCWQGIFVYSYLQKQWKQVAHGSVFACQDEDFSLRIKNRASNQFDLISDTWDDADMVQYSETYSIP